MPPEITYPGIYIEELPSDVRATKEIPTSITAFLGRAARGSSDEPVTVTSFAEFERAFGGLRVDLPMGYAVRDFFSNGGRQAVIVRLVRRGRRRPGPAARRLRAKEVMGTKRDGTGLYALDRADLFNLLCIPPDRRGGDTPWTVYRAAMRYCAQRRAMLIVDPPAARSRSGKPAASAAARVLRGLRLPAEHARNAALYLPRLVQADPLRDGELGTFVACGAVAGVMARTDAERGVWKAPAGTDAMLNGVAGLQEELTDEECESLGRIGINCLRTLAGAGAVVWGARTLAAAYDKASEWKYVPVRRLALFLEESIHRGTEWAVFEPNDEPLWAQIRSSVGAFLHGLFRQGAFPGAKSDEAYFVRCGADTTTQKDIERGLLHILVGFAPLKPAEFVIIRIQQRAGRTKG